MNQEDAQWCVQTSSLEKSARLAAKNIFRRLNPLATNVISKQDYLSAINSGEFNKQEKKLLEGAGMCMVFAKKRYLVCLLAISIRNDKIIQENK